eukprot:13567640-Alexandrium_andersonii.AAC.1
MENSEGVEVTKEPEAVTSFAQAVAALRLDPDELVQRVSGEVPEGEGLTQAYAMATRKIVEAILDSVKKGSEASAERRR